VHVGQRALRRTLVVLTGCALVVAPLTSASVAGADDVSDRKQSLDRQLDDLREDLEGTSQDLVDAAVKLRRSQAELSEATSALDGARSALDAAKARDAAIAARLQIARAAEEKAQRELDGRRDQEDATRARLGSIAREAYVSSGMSNLSIALNAQSPEQFADRVNVAGTALRTQNGAIERLQVQQAETRAREDKLSAARAEVADLKKQSEAVVEARRAAEEQAAQARSTIATATADRASAVRHISKRKSAEEARLDRMEAEQNRLADVLRARARRNRGGGGDGGGGGSDGGSSLSRPVGSPITSPFGWRYHPILHYSRLHGGTDFGAPCGTPVRAAAGGSIVTAGWGGGFGNRVVIDHGRMRGSDLASSYNHLSRIIKHSGTVSRGQVIGYSGTTGLSTGCHLHFEVYKNGDRVNPMNWL
jgi:murein DD-endopeptidase MepM/ murein hydrolase activator NlpD